MRRVGGDVDGLAGTYDLPGATEHKLKFAFEQAEGLLKIVPMRRQPSLGRYVHVDRAEAAGGVFPSQKNGVGVSHYANVTNISIGVRLGNREAALRIVWRYRGNGLSR